MDLIITKQGQGSCGYIVSEDDVKLLSRKSTVPVQQSRQRTHDDFWEGCLNDEMGDELGKGDGLHVQIKRMRIADSPASPFPVNLSETLGKKDAGAALNAANSKRDGFPDLVFDDDDDLEFANSVSWETVEAEAFLLLSCLSTPSRICWRQIMFQRRIFSNVSFGNMYFILSCFLCFHNMFLSFMFPLFFCFFWSKVTSF